MNHFKSFILFNVLVLASIFCQGQNILINEIMTSNSSFMSDEDGSFEDWIELYNAGDLPVNLKGFALSDDISDSLKWIFPSYEIQPGEFLLVWASGKDRRPVMGEMLNGIQRRVYSDITGSGVDDLVNHQSFPDNPASSNIVKNYFESPVNIDDNYGQHMFTWLKAPQTGNFIFRIASDDNSRLYLSTDETPENAVLIAEVPEWTYSREWDKFSQQVSDRIFLQEGQIYYISALMKEAQGGDNLAVMWNLPDGSSESPVSGVHCFIPGQYLHTNFRISSGDEGVFLTNPEGKLMDSVLPLIIPTNSSYGRIPDQINDWGYFNEPTPGEINNTPVFNGISPKPTISPGSGVYTSKLAVTINVTDSLAQIYYTTNGSQPGIENGILYQQPFTVNYTAYVRAVAVIPGNLPGETAAAVYTLAHSDIEGFSSNLPVMVIHRFNMPISDEVRTPAYINIFEPIAEGMSKLDNHPALSGRIGFKIRGSSSQMFPKKGYGFHTLKEDNSNRKVEILGMPEEHNWILHGPYSDKSLMRNAVSYSIGEDIGPYAPRTRFIELFLHSGSGLLRKSNYHGVYLLTERIKVAPGRVEIEELEHQDNEYPEVSGGYIFKIDRLNPGEIGFKTQRGSEFSFDSPSEADLSPNQKNYLKAYVDSLETALFGPGFTDPNTGYAAFMDAQSFIDVHLITELTKEIDGFRLSTFFSKDREGKIHAGPLWDFNLSFGNVNYKEGFNPIGWYYNELSDYEYNFGWYKRLFQDPEFTAQYKRRYRSLRVAAFSNNQLFGKIADNKKFLQDAQKRNFEKWKILGVYIWPNWFIAHTYEQEINWMSEWMRQRLQWMDSQLGKPYTMIHYWNFNAEPLIEPTYTLTDANLTINGGIGSEIISGSGQDFMGANARGEDKPETHLRINKPIGTELIFHLSTKDYEDILFSYETNRSGSGANQHLISYSVDSVTYIPFDTLITEEKPQVKTLDFMGVEGVSDNPLFSIKIIIAFDAANEGGMLGNNRFDNFALDGEALAGVIRPPVQVLPMITHLELIEKKAAHNHNLGQIFNHPDARQLTYTVHNPKPELATITFNGNNMVINPLKRGGTTISLDVSDGVNPPIKKTFYLLIHPEAIAIANEGFVFSSWSPDEPEGSFPAHMLFLQSNVDDPHKNESFSYAYSIPVDDYATDDQGNIGFPYRNQSRTRINGLNSNGISFINTGRGRDLGSAVLAIDTRETDAVMLQWKASTIRSNSRVYSLSLQYRVGVDASWKNWLNSEGNPIIYQRAGFAGQSEIFTDHPLPSEAMGKPYVQIRWLYHYTGDQLNTESGARDMLGLNMISINDATSVDDINTAINKLFIFPNPAKSGEIYLNKTVSGQLLNIQGRVITTIIDSRMLSVPEIEKGIYLFRSNEGETIKVIID
jgi:hypothetical protein